MYVVDGLLQLDEVSLPEKVQALHDEGRAVRASYHVEVITAVRGSRTALHHRTAANESAVFCEYDKYVKGGRPKHLFSAFLMSKERVNKKRPSLGFSVDLRVLVPEYEVNGFWFNDDHYDGGYLFRDKINLEVTFVEGEAPRLDYGFDKETPNRTAYQAEVAEADDGYTYRIQVKQDTRPGLRGTLVLKASRWSES